MVIMMRNGINKKKGALNQDKRTSIGRMASVPQVPGAFGKNPTPKKERNMISGCERLGAFFSFIGSSYNASSSKGIELLWKDQVIYLAIS